MKSLLSCMSVLVAFLLLNACQQTVKPPADVSSDGTVGQPVTAKASPPPRAATRAEILGTWYIEYIGERPVIDRSPARVQFTKDGAINGNASCNRFFGSYEYADQQLGISSDLGATKMMCLPALMEQEQRLFQHLPKAVQANFINELLILRDAQGNQIVRASRDESQ